MIWFLFLFNFLAKLTFSWTHCLSPGCLSSHSSIPNCILHLIDWSIVVEEKWYFFDQLIFWPAFFRWLLHTFLPRFPYFFATSEKNFFLPLFFPPPTTPIMFYLPECQFYISPHFWISKFPDLNNSLPPPSLVALPFTTICLLLHQLTVHFAIDYWIFTQNSQLIWQQLTHWLLKLQVVFLIILQPASTAASTTPNAVHVATISTTAIDHSFFNHQTQQHNGLPQFLLPRFRQLPLTIDCSASKHKSFPTSCSSCKFTIFDV